MEAVESATVYGVVISTFDIVEPGVPEPKKKKKACEKRHEQDSLTKVRFSQEDTSNKQYNPVSAS